MDIIFLIFQFIIIGLVCFIKLIPFIVKGFPRNYFINIYMNRVGNRFPNFNRFTNFNNRDNAFIDIDGEILISNKNQTHGQVIQEYISIYIL